MDEIQWYGNLFRLLGIAVLLLASMLYGRKRIREERQKIREAEALLLLTEYIAEQIEYTMKPLPEILAGFDSPLLCEMGFTGCAAEIGMRKAWERYRGRFQLKDGKIQSEFTSFCREIGRGYRKEELELCGLTAKHLRSELERMKGDAGNREKLYRTIPPLMVLSAALILL